MYCPRCGQLNPAETPQCENCGHSLVLYTAAPPQPDAIPSFLVQAILVTLFCCQPFGIVAIVYAAMTTSKISSGDYAGAMDCSQNARKWCWWSFWLGFIPMFLYVIFMVVGAMS